MEETTMEKHQKDWRARGFDWLEKCTQDQRFPPYVLPGVLLVAVYLLVYLTGGIKFAYSHSMYIPIILAAFSNGLKGGIIFGLLGGILLGPFMPLDVATGQEQETLNWLYRMVFFVMIGGLAGVIFETTRYQIERTSWAARHETFTGFANRYALVDTLTAALKENTSPKPTALAILSFANDGGIRSSFGPTALDEAIAQLWDRIEKTIETDIQLFRVQSNEVGVLFFERTRSDIESALDSVMIEAKLPYLYGESVFFGDIRIAATEITPLIDDPGYYLQECEASLHKADNDPTEQTGYFDHTDTALERETLSMLGALQDAMDSPQALHLYYQPKIDLKTRSLVGAEALIRWEHPELGFIPPGKFIPRAEKTTLINQLTDWVIENALFQVARWREKGMEIPISVNVSVRNLHQKEFETKVKRALEKYQVDARFLELEITENVLMHDAESMIDRLMRLTELGVRLSIDDYGTGFSSLKYMLQIPASPIKIDVFFVQGMKKDKNARSLVKSIISASHGLGKEVVAEGVEDEKTLDLLTKMGCDMAQGFFIGRPMPAEKFLTWKKEWEDKNAVKTAVTDGGQEDGMGKNTKGE
jgi:EAL domain-containing protein (putative c-di-GMP-specific phosphodiesterase class I)/GGDEF domain-containing protein